MLPFGACAHCLRRKDKRKRSFPVNAICHNAFSHDVTAAILVSQNSNETLAILVSQTNPVGGELFSLANILFCFIFQYILHGCWPRERKRSIQVKNSILNALFIDTTAAFENSNNFQQNYHGKNRTSGIVILLISPPCISRERFEFTRCRRTRDPGHYPRLFLPIYHPANR